MQGSSTYLEHLSGRHSPAVYALRREDAASQDWPGSRDERRRTTVCPRTTRVWPDDSLARFRRSLSHSKLSRTTLDFAIKRQKSSPAISTISHRGDAQRTVLLRTSRLLNSAISPKPSRARMRPSGKLPDERRDASDGEASAVSPPCASNPAAPSAGGSTTTRLPDARM
mmetsp:Transcript_12667/g.39997  ORF Transcript_12667/g.39997 Transcript_12667/m.39997 type:complete len:169 (-) Transcript_12667:1764-2270(-)